MKLQDIAKIIERVAPRQLQESYDNAGLQIGDPEMEVSAVLTTLDVTEETIRQAAEMGANLIVSHHPLLFRGVKQINPKRDYISRVIIGAIQHNIAIYSAHTNLDNAPMGVNHKIGELLELIDIKPLARLSEGQTAGLDPGFVAGCGSGIIGKLPVEMNAYSFAQMVKEKFHIDALMANTEDVSIDRTIRTVALCGGAGDDFIGDAVRKGADVFLTGECGYHLYFGHPEILILCGGHYETEQYTSELLKDIILQQFPDLNIQVARKSSPVSVL